MNYRTKEEIEKATEQRFNEKRFFTIYEIENHTKTGRIIAEYLCNFKNGKWYVSCKKQNVFKQLKSLKGLTDFALKICLPSDSEKVLNYLLENKANRANAIDLHGLPFQIGIFRADAGFLVATAYENGKPSKNHKGLILSRDVILNWLEDSKAEIPQNAEVK